MEVKLKAYLSYLERSGFLCLTSNDLLQWSNIRGQNGGQIESSCKYIMWGIKLEDLIPQAYLDYLER